MSTTRRAPAVTPSQTIGPFFHDALEWCEVQSLAAGPIVRGVVLDGRGQPVDDALVEVWQPPARDAAGGGVPAGFQRVASDAEGRFAFAVSPAQGSYAVAHITLFARGLLRALRTRVYLGASVTELRRLEGLSDIPDALLQTLLARADGDGYRWDVRLQGEDETLFLELT